MSGKDTTEEFERHLRTIVKFQKENKPTEYALDRDNETPQIFKVVQNCMPVIIGRHKLEKSFGVELKMISSTKPRFWHRLREQ